MNSSMRVTHEKLQVGGRILVTRLRHLGDLILSLPLITALRHTYPNSTLDYLADAMPLQVLQGHPDLRQLWATPRGLRPFFSTVRQLRAQRYDLIIDLYSNPRSAILSRAAQAKESMGESRRLRRHLYSFQRHLKPGRDAIRQHLAACTELSGVAPQVHPPRLFLSSAELQRGAEVLESCGCKRRHNRTLLLHLGASSVTKEWGAKQALSFAASVLKADYHLVLGQAPNRPQPSALIMERLGESTCLLPVLSLREYMSVLSQAAVVVSVDGGMLHAAVALQRPTIALFGPTDPNIWFPYEPFGPYRVLSANGVCSDCRHKPGIHQTCMHTLEPGVVFQALSDLVSLRSSKS